ncbi:MAG: hypothetical protein MJ248_00135 [Bacilli bacterium]|nr:hypothetical protein [Bacilli bacterium]
MAKNKNKAEQTPATEDSDLYAKPKSKRSTKSLVLAIAIPVVGVTIFAGGGYGIGFAIAKLTKPEIVEGLDMDDEEIKQLEDDTGDLLTRYAKCKEEGKEPSEVFTLDEICNIGALKFQALDNTMSLGFGYAAAAGNVSVLDVRNTTVRNGNTYFEESVSKSASGVDVKVAERAYQTGEDIKVHEASFPKGADAEHPSWKSDYKTWEREAYKENYGKYVDTLGIYIVSSKTILTDAVDGNGNPLTYIEKDENGYTLQMEMDTVKTVPRYVRRMHALSNSDVNQFFYVHLEYRLDLDLNLVYSFVHEQYAAALGTLTAKTTGRMITYYYTDQDYMIPDIKTPINYDLKGEKLPTNDNFKR